MSTTFLILAEFGGISAEWVAGSTEWVAGSIWGNVGGNLAEFWWNFWCENQCGSYVFVLAMFLDSPLNSADILVERVAGSAEAGCHPPCRLKDGWLAQQKFQWNFDR